MSLYNHVTRLLRNRAPEYLAYDDVQALLDLLHPELGPELTELQETCVAKAIMALVEQELQMQHMMEHAIEHAPRIEFTDIFSPEIPDAEEMPATHPGLTFDPEHGEA